MGRLCYITRNYRNLDGAGNKAKVDNEDTLASLGAVNLGIRRTHSPSKVLTFLLVLAGVIKYTFSVRKGDIIILQYPVKKYFAYLCRVAHMRGAKVAAVIHDLGSFRRNKLTVEKEISRLMNADYVIASNAVMRDWLIDKGYKHPVGVLGLFDYRSAAEAQQGSASFDIASLRLVYAGALAMRKNSFLLTLAETELPYNLHIYGNRSGLPDMKDNKSITFHAFTPADEFIKTVDADFGLVWDGDSLDKCSGNFGEYLRYNSPHKVSFYIRACLPVIIWRQAAVASIVESEGIGICIDSLEELEQRLGSLTKDEYNKMKENVREVSSRLQNGEFFSSAVKEACRQLES